MDVDKNLESKSDINPSYKFPVYSRSKSILLFVLFFTGGFTSLVYQVAWQRVITQVVGVDAWSVSLIIAIFMAGLGFGGFFGGHLASLHPQSMRLLAIIQWIVGLFGIFSVPIIRGINQVFQGIGGDTGLLFLNFGLLFIPTFLMGVTGPLMVHLYRNSRSATESVGKAYTINILGASLGALVSGFWLVGTYGLSQTCRLMGGIDIILGLLFFSLARKETGQKLSLSKLKHAFIPGFNTSASWNEWNLENRIVTFSFVVGFVALAYEIVFFRMFTTFFGITPYVFPMLLFCYLVNMALGTFLAPHIERLIGRQKSIYILIGLALVSTLPILYFHSILLNWGPPQAQLQFVLDSSKTLFETNLGVMIQGFFLALVLMFPIAALSGLFPLLVGSLQRESRMVGGAFGKLYGIQTVGNTLGAIATGFLLFSFMGVVGILKFLAFFILIAFLLCKQESFKTLLKSPVPILSLACVPFFLYPTSSEYYSSIRYYRAIDKPIPPKFIRDTLDGMTLFYPKDDKESSFSATASGRFHISSFHGNALESKNLVFQSINANIMYALKPDAKRVLVVGMGTTTEVLAFEKLFPGIEIDLVEINANLVEVIKKHGISYVVDSLNRVNLNVMDGRRFLMHHSKKDYDLVYIDVHRATTSGSANLFSQEFFGIIKDSLNDGGVLGFYTYPSAIKAAINVFPEVYAFIAKPYSIGTVVGIKSKTDKTQKHAALSKKFFEKLRQAGSLLGENSSKAGYRLIPYLDKGFVFPKLILKKIFEEIKPITDDLLVTEYFLNNNIERQPGLNRNGRPVDFRMLPVVKGAMSFSVNERLNFDFGEGIEVASWAPDDSDGDIVFETKFSGGPEDAIEKVSSEGTQIQIGFKESWNFQKGKKPDWQWDLANFPVQKDYWVTFEVEGEKEGRGEWGIKAYKPGGKVEEITTLKRGKTHLTLTYPPVVGKEKLKLYLVFKENLGLGKKSRVSVNKIRVYKHKNSYWRPG